MTWPFGEMLQLKLRWTAGSTEGNIEQTVYISRWRSRIA
jgi:hypothetical protein